MSGGYGSVTLNMLRQLYGTMHHDSEFPLTLGRDFSGHIVDMGCGVDQNVYRIGDAVSCAKVILDLSKNRPVLFCDPDPTNHNLADINILAICKELVIC